MNLQGEKGKRGGRGGTEDGHMEKPADTANILHISQEQC